MTVRVSEGKFLEVLESAPALDTGIEIDVFDGANPATMLATLEGASAKRFTRELSETGTGAFAIARSDPKATAAILAQGNLVKFRVAGEHRHAIWIEEPSTVVVAAGEEAAEVHRITGRGALAYLDRGEVYPPVWPIAAAAFVASSAADNGAGATSLAIAKPAGTAAGDILAIAIATLGAAPSTPSGWKRIRNTTNGSLRLCTYRRRAVSGEPGTITFHWASATAATAGAIALRNASSDDTTWAINDTTGSGTSVEEPSVSVGLVNGVLLGFAASASATAITPPAGLTETIDEDGTGRRLEVAYALDPALGDTGDLTATAGSAAWIGMQIWIPSTAAADAIFEGSTFGAVLATLIDEAQARGTIPHLTYDFTATVDSHGEPWPDVHDLAFHVGTNLLEVWRHLVTLGLEGGMTPHLRLQAFVDASRHFEDTVVMRKGHHFAGEVVESAHGTGRRTRYLVEGAGGRIVEVTDPATEADAHIGRQEGYLSLSTSDNPTTLQRAGEMAIAAAAAEDQARFVTVDHGPAIEGLYEPWVDYREGDWIGVDPSGSGGAPIAQRVVSVTLEEEEAGAYAPQLELNSVELDAFLRLQRRMDALARTSTASGSGGASGGTSAATGKVAAVATDTPGFLNDKLTVDATLTKALVGDTGSQRLQLGVAPGGSLEVKEADGTPDVTGVSVIKVGNGDLTDEGGGVVRIKTAADAAGGGGTSVDAPDGKPYNFTPPSSPNAKDDEFADASGQSGPVNGLDAKWSKRNLGTSSWLRLDDSYCPGCLGLDIPTGQSVDQYVHQAVPAGDFVVAVRFNWLYLSDRQMWGPVIVDTSGNGMGIRFDSGDTTPRLMEVNAWLQTGTVTDLTPTYSGALLFVPITAWLRKSGNNFYAAATLGDRALRPMLNEVTRSRTFTAAYAGFGRMFGSGVSKVALDYFRVA